MLILGERSHLLSDSTTMEDGALVQQTNQEQTYQLYQNQQARLICHLKSV